MTTGVLAFIDGAIARGLTTDEILAAIRRDPALHDAAVEAAFEDLIRNTIREQWDLDYDPLETFPGMTDDAGLLRFLKRREQKK
jgi:hypothetical protein